jgi:hypothetical protein
VTEKSSSQILFLVVSGCILAGSVAALIYFSFLMPLHQDEAGYWFNFTNKSFANRSFPIAQIPNHTLSIYLAKLSLLWFGYTGIGLRFPVILFGVLDVVLIFFWIRHVSGSSTMGLLGACCLFLLPWFTHHAHELRGYSSYIFFSLISIFALRFLLLHGDRFRYWLLLLVSFLGGYYSSLGSVVFIFNFMATIWILKLWQSFKPGNVRVASFEAISFKSLFLFSTVAVLIMMTIMFVLDPHLLLRNREYQDGLQWMPFVLIKDVFSTFLGFHYLDDSGSLIYKYPVILYLFSLVCCGYGIWTAYRERLTEGTLFLTLYGTTILFVVLMGQGLQTRAVCYLLPFIVLFQVLGLSKILARLFPKNLDGSGFSPFGYQTLVLFLAIYFVCLMTGKYQNMDGNSGNPFEKSRQYLIKNSKPNDLIISSLQDTVSGFYFGKLILDQNKTIFKMEDLNAIYYLSHSQANPPKIKLQNYLSEKKSLGLEDSFNELAHFENGGVRGKEIFIYKMDIGTVQKVSLGWEQLIEFNFFGGEGKCEKKRGEFGLQLQCPKSILACSDGFQFPGLSLDGFFQLILFSYRNELGTRSKTMVSLEEARNDSSGNVEILIKSSLDDNYFINLSVDNIEDLDHYKRDVRLYTPFLQKLESGREFILCLAGDLFRNNSSIEKVVVINFKPEKKL